MRFPAPPLKRQRQKFTYMMSAVATSPSVALTSATPAPLTGAAPCGPSGASTPQLHTRYWAAHGVQVVRQGEPSQIVPHAELFLLTDPRSLRCSSSRR